MEIPAPAFIAQCISTTPSTAYLRSLTYSNPPGFGNPAEERLFSHCLVPPNRRTPRTLIMPALPSLAQLTPGARLSPTALFSRHHPCRATPFSCHQHTYPPGSYRIFALLSAAYLRSPAWPSLPAFTSSLALFPLRRSTSIRTAGNYCSSDTPNPVQPTSRAQRCSVSQPSPILPSQTLIPLSPAPTHRPLTALTS